MLMFPNWGQTARVTRIQLTTPPSNSSVKLSSPLLNLCLPSTARAYRFSRVGVFPHSLAFSLSPLPILLLLFFDRKKLDLSVNKNKTDIYFAYFRRGVIEFENSETSASNRAEDTRHPPRHDIRDSRRLSSIPDSRPTICIYIEIVTLEDRSCREFSKFGTSVN